MPSQNKSEDMFPNFEETHPSPQKNNRDNIFCRFVFIQHLFNASKNLQKSFGLRHFLNKIIIFFCGERSCRGFSRILRLLLPYILLKILIFFGSEDPSLLLFSRALGPKNFLKVSLRSKNMTSDCFDMAYFYSYSYLSYMIVCEYIYL